MVKLISLSILLVFFLNFSGRPHPAAQVVIADAVTYRSHGLTEDDEYIPWSENRRLTWDDFLCAPQHNTDAVASTSTALGLSYQIKNNHFAYQITCNFSKVHSWGLIKTPYILAHEQGHFDITELFARKLNKALQEYKLNPKNYKKDIDAIYQNIIEQKEIYQNDYDGETDHSRHKKEQAEWLLKIDKLLQESQPYDNYP